MAKRRKHRKGKPVQELTPLVINSQEKIPEECQPNFVLIGKPNEETFYRPNFIWIDKGIEIIRQVIKWRNPLIYEEPKARLLTKTASSEILNDAGTQPEVVNVDFQEIHDETFAKSPIWIILGWLFGITAAGMILYFLKDFLWEYKYYALGIAAMVAVIVLFIRRRSNRRNNDDTPLDETSTEYVDNPDDVSVNTRSQKGFSISIPREKGSLVLAIIFLVAAAFTAILELWWLASIFPLLSAAAWFFKNEAGRKWYIILPISTYVFGWTLLLILYLKIGF